MLGKNKLGQMAKRNSEKDDKVDQIMESKMDQVEIRNV